MTKTTRTAEQAAALARVLGDAQTVADQQQPACGAELDEAGWEGFASCTLPAGHAGHHADASKIATHGATLCWER